MFDMLLYMQGEAGKDNDGSAYKAYRRRKICVDNDAKRGKVDSIMSNDSELIICATIKLVLDFGEWWGRHRGHFRRTISCSGRFAAV